MSSGVGALPYHAFSMPPSFAPHTLRTLSSLLRIILRTLRLLGRRGANSPCHAVLCREGRLAATSWFLLSSVLGVLVLWCHGALWRLPVVLVALSVIVLAALPVVVVAALLVLDSLHEMSRVDGVVRNIRYAVWNRPGITLSDRVIVLVMLLKVLPGVIPKHVISQIDVVKGFQAALVCVARELRAACHIKKEFTSEIGEGRI